VAELSAFGYIDGDSLPHRLDARFKIITIIVFSLVILSADLAQLGLLTALLLIVIFQSRLPVASAFKELRYFFILLSLIFVARLLTADETQMITLRYFTISMQGVCNAIIVCWRLTLIIMLGFCFMTTTSPAAIKAAVQWFLKPVPFVPEKKVAVMMGLILRFVPVILDQARETAEAQKARAVENRKNPLYRLTKFGLPLIRRTFERADDLIVAMQARAFTEQRTDPKLTAEKKDWFVLMVVCCLGASLIMI
jgi:energy-coupling factor transporter transmembrane protein EcfT